jgi:hypothetical protein
VLQRRRRASSSAALPPFCEHDVPWQTDRLDGRGAGESGGGDLEEALIRRWAQTLVGLRLEARCGIEAAGGTAKDGFCRIFS